MISGRTRALLTVLGISILALLWISSPTRAASQTQVLTVTPSTVHPKLDPGSSLQGSFQVINQGESAYQLQIYTSPYSVKTEAYTPYFSPIPGKSDVTNWIHLSPSQASIKPNESLTVNYTVSVPAGTEPGGYYAVAFAETKSPPGASQGVVINERVGEIFYIDVAGPVKKSGKILTWTSSFLQNKPVTATLKLENDGGIDYQSNINISVNDLFGNSKVSFVTQKAVLPQTIRDIPFEWKNAPALGIFKIQGSATIFGKTEILPTKYVLAVSPLFRVIFLALILVVLAWFAGRLLARRRLRRRKDKEPAKPKG